MNVISIFIAGAKNLKEQRLRLKALANDLNSKYGRQKWKVSLHMNSYENYGDRQDEYNEFITNQADLVIFVFEERVGPKTEEEFLLAANANKQRGHPKIISFVRASDERTPEIEHIEQLVTNATGTYYVDYLNLEDLISKAKDRIDAFVETRVNQEKWFKSRPMWKKGLLYVTIGLFLAFFLFIASILFSPESYLIVTTPDPPASLTKAGMGKEFIKQQIVEGVRETGDSAQWKLELILNELKECSGIEAQNDESAGSPLSLSVDFKNIVKANIESSSIWWLRKLLGKMDVKTSVRLVETEHAYISRITLDTWDGRHDVKTIELKKKDFTSNQRCALSVIKKSAAYITMAYSPVASALYDYHPSEGLEVYQMNSPWQEDLYTHSRREAMLLENSKSDCGDAAYGLLLVADIYEKENMERPSLLMAQKAIDYYNQFLKQNNLFQSDVKSKIQDLEATFKQEKLTGNSIPDILTHNGVIPNKSFCKQLIVVTDEEPLYNNGTTYYKATLHAFELKDEKWTEVFPAYYVNLGANGIAPPDKKKEGDLMTPSGFYPILFAFGYKNDVETKMDFVVVGKDHVWVCDTLSADYNKLVMDKDGKYRNNLKNEKLLRPDVLNKYAISIGYNMSPIIKGKGSAIFMHVERSANHKTAGCISMPEKNIVDLIKWLDPQKNPYIYISKQCN